MVIKLNKIQNSILKDVYFSIQIKIKKTSCLKSGIRAQLHRRLIFDSVSQDNNDTADVKVTNHSIRASVVSNFA